ncbi:MAG: hypothetical protein AAGK14_13085 [Verrucomicrobiota bacterium]
MKTCRLCLPLVAALLLAPNPARAAAPVLAAPDLGFSAELPVNWTLTDMPGSEYRVGSGPTEGDFRVNLQISGVTSGEDLRGFTGDFERALQTKEPGYRLVSLEGFKTDAGLDLMRLVVESQMRAHHLQFFYLGPATKDRYFVLKASVPVSQVEKYGPVFDGVAKSIKVDAPPPSEEAPEAVAKPED